MITNAHLHLIDSYSPADFKNQIVCFCAGSEAEFDTATSFARTVNKEGPRCFVSAGIHPWTVADGAQSQRSGLDQQSWLERILQTRSNEVAAIGECGIDLYTPELKSVLPLQLDVFESQMELASRYEKPLVIHSRRSVQYFFKYAPRLKKLPAVIFHAFPGTFSECESLVKNGINAYFSFGGVFLRGGKKAVECVERLPDDRLLLETDVDENGPSAIVEVFAAAADIRGVSVSELEAVCGENFRRAYGV